MITSAVSTNFIQLAGRFRAKIGQYGNLTEFTIDPDQ